MVRISLGEGPGLCEPCLIAFIRPLGYFSTSSFFAVKHVPVFPYDMNANLKVYKEHLARAKGYYHRLERGYERGDLLRCLLNVAAGIQVYMQMRKELFGRERMEADNALIVMMNQLDRVDELKVYYPGGVKFQKGKEKLLLAYTLKAVQDLNTMIEQETLEATMARKLKIDQFLNKAQVLLGDNKIELAEERFKWAVEQYVDEHSLFSVIAKKLMEANQVGRALKYWERAMDVDPELESVYLMAAEAYEKSGDVSNAEMLLNKALSEFGDKAGTYLQLSQVYLSMGKDQEAHDAATKTLELDATLVKAKKVLDALTKKGFEPSNDAF